VLAAYLVASLHAAVVVLVLAGGLLALKHRRLLLVHLPLTLALVGVNLVGADCPLTDLEKTLRGWAGGEVYSGGFLEHYVFDPLGLDGRSGPVQLAQRLLVLVPNAIAYALLALHLRRDRRSTGAVHVPA
jgi:hypothetical protein